MQRMILTVSALALAALVQSPSPARAQDAPVYLPGCELPNDPMCLAPRETRPYQPHTIDITHVFRCSDTSKVTVEWGRTGTSDALRSQGLGGAQIVSLDWSGRRPSDVERSAINAVIRPHEQPRWATLSCEGDRNVLTLDFWEVRNGSSSVRILMDADGFRPVPPLPQPDAR